VTDPFLRPKTHRAQASSGLLSDSSPASEETHDEFTHVELIFLEKRVQNWIRYGTVVSRIDILRAVRSGERYSTVPFVRPGGESLLRLAGWPKVEKVLQAIDIVEALGIDPVDAAPEHWRHVHNRLSVGERPRPYTPSRHRAWLHRRKAAP